MRGLKPGSATADTPVAMSHLLQMRGLKRELAAVQARQFKSHLLQMRGLKLSSLRNFIMYRSRIFYRCVD